jgi:hypothetical protein
MQSALGNKSSPTALELLEASEQLLDNILRTDCDSRSSALDLLTVDALVTRALEEAAKDPSSASEFADRAMRRIGSRRYT